MSKKLLFAALLTALLISFCSVFADQEGRNCWCNIDQYGCWITNEDGGKVYIMFWTEEARQYIMGPHSAPYELVVTFPGASATLPIECGIMNSSALPTAGLSVGDEENQEETPEYDSYDDCMSKRKCLDDYEGALNVDCEAYCRGLFPN